MSEKGFKLSRREFIKLGIATAGSLALVGCVKEYESLVSSFEETVSTLPPPPSSTPPKKTESAPTPIHTEALTSTPIPTETAIPRYSSEALKKLVSSEESFFLTNNQILRGDPSKPNVLITYDGGNNNKSVGSIIDAYDRHGVKCTFFFIGESLANCAESINRAIENGHEIACHGYYHEIPLTQLPISEVEEQFENFVNEFNQIAPGYRVKFWRAPYGFRNEKVLKIAADYGMQHVLWNVGSGGVQPETFDILFNAFDLNAHYYKSPNGLIVLSHAFRYYDITLADKIVTEFLDRGLTPVTMSEGMKPEDKFAGR